MKKLTLILQQIIKCSIIFLICFIWLKFATNSMFFSLIISLGITLLIQGIWIVYSKSKNEKISLKFEEKENAEKMFTSIATSSSAIEFFFSLLSTRHKNVKKQKNYVSLEEDGKKFVFFPSLTFHKLTIDETTSIAKEFISHPPEKVVILTGEIEQGLTSFIKNFPFKILILDKYETYRLLYKDYDYFPQVKKNIKTQRLTVGEFFSIIFQQKHAKGYVFSSLFLLMSGVFIKLSIYYCISISVLLIFATICLMNKTPSKSKELI